LHYDEEYIINNPLYPYGLVFVSEEGEIIYGVKQSKYILDLLRSSCMFTSADPEEERNSLIQRVHTPGHQQHLRKLFKVAIRSIQGHAELSVASSVFRPGATVTPVNSGGHGYVLINYVLIQ